METTHLPKVSKILSSKPVAESTAFQAVARFLEKEQKRLDPVAIQKATHLNDVYLVCEALAKADHEKDHLERLRNSSAIQVEKHTKRFHFSNNNIVVEQPSQVAEEDQQHPPVAVDTESPVCAAENVPSMPADPDAPRSESATTVKQEIVADEQPSAMQLPTYDHIDTKRKLKVEKKAKKEKKKKRHKNEERG